MRTYLLLMAAFLALGCNDGTQPNREDIDGGSGIDQKPGNPAVVQVKDPTGNAPDDVASIREAIARVPSGGTVQFAKGTYKIATDEIAEQIVVSVPGVTLQGHPGGTTIEAVVFLADYLLGHFLLNGGHQTVRNLTFQNFSTALSLGESRSPVGGYRIENCTFRQGDLGLELVGFSTDATTVENNDFINLSLPFVVWGKTLHFRNNRVTAPQPEKTPFGRPFNAGIIQTDFLAGGNICENNVLEGNSISGNADGFIIGGFEGEHCRNNVIRNNTFKNQRVFNAFDNGSLLSGVGPTVENNLITGNVLKGSEGLGIVIDEGKNNRIIGNSVSDLPGLKETFVNYPGTGIYLGPTTSGNYVAANKIKRVVTPILNLAGAANTVEAGQENIAIVSPRRIPIAAAPAVEANPKLRRISAHRLR
jgi:parallel beta-helix repeat protein